MVLAAGRPLYVSLPTEESWCVWYSPNSCRWQNGECWDCYVQL